MAFQAPFEIGQSELLNLRLTSVDSREATGSLFPFFDPDGTVRFLAILTVPSSGSEGRAGPWLVRDFPLEIRRGKAIYPRPILNYQPLAEQDPLAFRGFYHFDGRRILSAQPSLPEATAAALNASNVALRSRGKERVQEVYFTFDLRRLTGAATRSGLFSRSRLELAALKAFLRDTSTPGSLNIP